MVGVVESLDDNSMLMRFDMPDHQERTYYRGKCLPHPHKTFRLDDSEK